MLPVVMPAPQADHLPWPFEPAEALADSQIVVRRSQGVLSEPAMNGACQSPSRHDRSSWSEMPTLYVNMDALIPRDDFEVNSEDPLMGQSKLGQTMRITDLGADGLIYHVLRKP